MPARTRIKKLARLVDPPWWTLSPKARSSEYAAMQLWKSGPQSVPFLMNMLQRGKDARRQSVLSALQRIGPADIDALPALVAALKSRPAAPVCRAIARMGPAGRPAVRALIAALPETDARGQAAIMRAFQAIGPEALDGFCKALTDPRVDWPVRQQAAESLVRLGPAARPAAEVLLLGLQDRSSRVRHACARALESAGLASAADLKGELGEDRLRRTGLTPGDLTALMVVLRLHSTDPDRLVEAAREAGELQQAGGAPWRKLEGILSSHMEDSPPAGAPAVGSELLVCRLLDETDPALRIEWANELGRRRAEWTYPLLQRIAEDPACDEALRYACLEVLNTA